MNKARRKILGKNADEIQKIITSLNQIKDSVDDVGVEEQDAMDNMPENLQMSYRYSEMEEAVDAITDAVAGLEEVIDKLMEAIG